MTGPYDSATGYLHWLGEDARAGGSEFGGVPGVLQPAPHEMTPRETLHAIYTSDTTDPEGPVPHTDQAAPSPHPEF